MRRLLTALLLVAGLSGCLPMLRGGGEEPPSPITGAPIEVTALDAPAGVAPAADDASGAVTGRAEDAAVVAAAVPPPVPEPSAELEEAVPAGEGAAAPAPLPPPKSAAERACERGGGHYAAAGSSGARACVRTTRDAGRQCRRQTQCEGLCLARSGTCAPVTPLFGCNEILQADGRRVTLCID